jgi:hypothetical protein
MALIRQLSREEPSFSGVLSSNSPDVEKTEPFSAFFVIPDSCKELRPSLRIKRNVVHPMIRSAYAKT